MSIGDVLVRASSLDFPASLYDIGFLDGTRRDSAKVGGRCVGWGDLRPSHLSRRKGRLIMGFPLSLLAHASEIASCNSWFTFPVGVCVSCRTTQRLRRGAGLGSRLHFSFIRSNHVVAIFTSFRNLDFWPVSRTVGNARNNGVEVIQRLTS